MSISIAEHLVLLLSNSINFELQMKVEDIQLIQLGFSYEDIQNMALSDRAQYLLIGNKIDSIQKLNELFRLVDVSVMGNGFASKSIRRRVAAGWKKELRTHISELNGMGIATAGAAPNRRRRQAAKSTSAPTAIPFKDKINQLRERRNMLGSA